MTNTNLLKAKFVENGLTQKRIADKLGISYQSLSDKVNNKVEFKASEIETLCKILNIQVKEPYFFSE